MEKTTEEAAANATPAPTLPQVDRLLKLFTFQKPTEETIPSYQAINEGALAFARIIDANCPPSADRSFAIRLVQQARTTANQSIALDGESYR